MDGKHNSVAGRGLRTSNEADRFLVSMMKGLGLNLAALLRETLYLL